MKRFIMVLGVMAIMAAMVAASAMPAFAYGDHINTGHNQNSNPGGLSIETHCNSHTSTTNNYQCPTH